MKVLAVLGSPRRNKNTAKLLNNYLDELQMNHEEAEITQIFVGDGSISPCMGCSSCKTSSEKKCVIDDDMHKYYPTILESDIIIFATPVYWFNMTTQLKSFIDRFYAFDYSKLANKKKVVLLTTFGAADIESSGAINIENSLKGMAIFLKLDFLHHIGVTASDVFLDGIYKEIRHNIEQIVV